MKKNVTDLSNLSHDELVKMYINLQTEYDSAMAKMKWYEEQYRAASEKRYGTSSEKNIPGQITFQDLQIFNEAEALREPINIEPQEEDLPIADNKKKGKKPKNLKTLPVITETFMLNYEDQVCDKCGNELHEMKDEIRLEIEVIPAKVQVHKYISKIYACRCCEKKGNSNIVKAPGTPTAIIPKSMASASLIADAVSKKYVDATPFYRQEQNYKRQGIPITRNNLCNWTIKVSNDYFKSIVNRMREIMYSDDVIHCDETFVEVLNEPRKPAYTKSYIWVTSTPKYRKDLQIALYNYKDSRSQVAAREVLKGYEGYIMCDGYAVYDAIAKKGSQGEEPMNTKAVACLVHVKRKFNEALKLLSPSKRNDSSAKIAVDMISKIFKADEEFDEMGIEERKNARLEKLKPMLEEFFTWVKSEYDQTLPKTKYGQALEYAISQEEKVLRVLEDGRLELDNNKAERTVKPFVIGRKNWLFSDTPQGAEASCILYSIVETAKINNLIPFEYIKYVLEKLAGKSCPTKEEIEELMPWSKSIPDYVRNPAE